MRREGFFGWVFSKVLDGGMSSKGLVRSKGVEFVGEGVDPSFDVVEVVVGQVPCGVELVSSGAVVALDVTVELGRSEREFEEVDAAALASKPALNSEPPSTWMASMGKGLSAWSLSRVSQDRSPGGAA